MKILIQEKSHTQKDGTIWVWNEGPELRQFILDQKEKNNSKNSQDLP